MTKSKKSKTRVLPIILIAASTAVLASLIPSAVLAARDNNTFILSMVIPAMFILLVIDGVAIALMRKARVVNSDR